MIKKYNFYNNNLIMYACIIIIIIVSVLAIIIPEIWEYEFDEICLSRKNLSPGAEHWFGTDFLGRDIWVRVWQGLRTTILIAVLGAIIPQIIGCMIGGISGYCGGIADSCIMAIVDVFTSIPSLIYITLLYLLLGPGIFSMLIAISVSSWTETARLVRSRILQCKKMDFVTVAKLQGASAYYIIVRHIFPNIAGQIATKIFLAIPGTIFIEAYLSFVGMGISSPNVSLGLMCYQGVSIYRLYPYQLAFPSILLCLLVLCFYVLGNFIRNKVDVQYTRS